MSRPRCENGEAEWTRAPNECYVKPQTRDSSRHTTHETHEVTTREVTSLDTTLWRSLLSNASTTRLSLRH